MDLHDGVRVLLVIHLAGLIMGFVGGRAHGVITSRISGAASDALAMLWEWESKASWTAFVGTALLVVSGVLMLTLKWGGLASQGALFWFKMVMVVVVAVAEIVRHQSALRWKAGDASMEKKTKVVGKLSGIAAVITLIAGVFNFN